MKTFLVCALLTVQCLAIRTQIRTSNYLRNNDNGDGAGDVGPGGANDEIINGKRPALTNEPAVVLKEQELKQPTSAVVTKEFCLKVLQDVAAKQPPYFNDGKFTGECRQELISQCGDRVCEWAKHFKDAASTCSGCPTDCAAQAQSRLAFFSSVPSAMNVLGDPKFLAAIQKEMMAHVTVVQPGQQATVVQAAPRFLGSGPGPAAPPAAAQPPAPPAAAQPPAPPAAAAAAPPATAAAAPPAAPVAAAAAPPAAPVAAAAPPPAAPAAAAQPPPAPPAAAAPKPADSCVGCPKTSVTKGFCQTMLQDVIDGKAPYFIEGKFTGESRSNLISQCGQHICSWALRVHVAALPKCGGSECCLPETCKMPQQYLQDVVAKGQLLDIIKLVGKDDILKSLDPANPPKSIPAQQAPVPIVNLRGPTVITKTIVGPSPNDPRDPDFKKGNKNAAEAISKDIKQEAAPVQQAKAAPKVEKPDQVEKAAQKTVEQPKEK